MRGSEFHKAKYGMAEISRQLIHLFGDFEFDLSLPKLFHLGPIARAFAGHSFSPTYDQTLKKKKTTYLFFPMLSIAYNVLQLKGHCIICLFVSHSLLIHVALGQLMHI